MSLVIIILTFAFFSNVDSGIKNWLCTADSCQEPSYPVVPVECYNKTAALIVKSYDVCNCYELCIKYLEEGDDCITDATSISFPDVMCGPGLTCGSTSKCEKMQNKEDDPDLFLPYNCDKGTCECRTRDETGTNIPIFGTFPDSNQVSEEPQCRCSLAAYKAQNQLNQFQNDPLKEKSQTYIQPLARCLPNGQFDSLQCVDDMCYCVEKATGKLNGTTPVPVHLIRPNFPACFDVNRHQRGAYYTECERERIALIEARQTSLIENRYLIYSHIISCKLDGTYDDSS